MNRSKFYNLSKKSRKIGNKFTSCHIKIFLLLTANSKAVFLKQLYMNSVYLQNGGIDNWP